MPIHFYQKPSMEKLAPGFRTTRFWLSVWAELTSSVVAVWGMQVSQPFAAGAGALSCAIVAGVYVWALSREP